MAMPHNQLSVVYVPTDFVYPENIPRINRLSDLELGGVALNDSSQGLQVTAWQAYISGTDFRVRKYPGLTNDAFLLTAAGSTEVSLAFDQSMNPALAFVQSGAAKFWWFDTFLAAYTITTLPAGSRTPMMTLDDHRASQSGASDMLLFYLSASGNLCYREQRERFNTERVLASGLGASTKIYQVGLAANLRMKIQIAPS